MRWPGGVPQFSVRRIIVNASAPAWRGGGRLESEHHDALTAINFSDDGFVPVATALLLEAEV
jgi:hypothetical protein